MESSKKNAGKNLIVQGSILALASIVVRLIGIIYRIPLTNIVGNEGMGYYGFAFEVYSFLVILSTSAIPVAVSKLTAARIARKEYRNAEAIFRGSIKFAAMLSGSLALITFIGAPLISKVTPHPRGMPGYPGGATRPSTPGKLAGRADRPAAAVQAVRPPPARTESGDCPALRRNPPA